MDPRGNKRWLVANTKRGWVKSCSRVPAAGLTAIGKPESYRVDLAGTSAAMPREGNVPERGTVIPMTIVAVLCLTWRAQR